MDGENGVNIFNDVILDSILSLYIIKRSNINYPIRSVYKDIVDYSESEVVNGNTSETLLILSSLSLDKKLDIYEVEFYFKRFINEVGVKEPTVGYSMLTWLHLEIEEILHSESRCEIEDKLSSFAFYWYESDNYFNRRAIYFFAKYILLVYRRPILLR